MQSNLTSQVITAASKSAKFTLQFTSMNNFSQLGIPIALSYTTPAGITCTSSPAAPNFGKTLYATVNFTCRAAAGSRSDNWRLPAIPANPRGLWMAEGGTALACIFLFGMPGRRRKWQSLLGSLALFVVAFGITGCGGMAMSQAAVLRRLINNSNSAQATPVPGSRHLYGDRDRHGERLDQLAVEHYGERRAQHTAQDRSAVVRAEADHACKGQASACPFTSFLRRLTGRLPSASYMCENRTQRHYARGRYPLHKCNESGYRKLPRRSRKEAERWHFI